MKKRLISTCITIFLGINSYAQENWGGGVDAEVLHWGFTFQYVSSEFKILKAEDWQSNYNSADQTQFFQAGKLLGISSVSRPGFGLGFVSDLRINEFTNLRFTPNLVFADKEIQYEYEQELFLKKVQSTTVEFPLGVKLKSVRRKNFRAYVLAGAKYSRGILSKKKFDDTELIEEEKLLRMKDGFLSYEAGIGLDLYFEYFKMSPEIKFSQSFNSVLQRRGNAFDQPINKLFHKGIQLSLFFE